MPASWLRRTVFICAEQPGSSHFEENVALAEHAGAVFDINRQSVREFERRGVAARSFQLGYTSLWDPDIPSISRDIDALFLGSESPRRLRALATYGDVLWKWRSHLVLSDNRRPNFEPSESFVADDEKWRLLRRSKVLLNVHQGDVPYFEWLRMVQAITSRCAVVSEHSVDFEPLEPGRHFVPGRPEALHFLAESLLEDDDRRQLLADEAYAFLRSELALRSAVEELVAGAEDLRRLPVQTGRNPPVLTVPAPPTDLFAPLSPADSTNDPNISVLKAAVKDLRLEIMSLRREVAALGAGTNARRPLELEVDACSPAWLDARARVSVLVTVYNYAHHVEAALSSVAEGRYRDVEFIVVDDASTDRSCARVRDWMESHPAAPALLLRHPVNRGLPAARNAALGFARGEYCFILDADNEIYPAGLQRLVDRLDADAGADFAYGVLQRFSVDGPLDLVSRFPWEPSRLTSTNYIDAMALLRTAGLRDLGGYTTDTRLHGWEDYDLWCHHAELGGRGAFVPEIVARYRSSPHSMLSLTNISPTTAFSVLTERYPTVFAGIRTPL